MKLAKSLDEVRELAGKILGMQLVTHQTGPAGQKVRRLLIEEGVEHLHLFLHSSSLLPGLTPYAPSGAAVERLYAAVARYVEGLAKMTPLRFGTVPEVAGTLLPVGGAD